jgi:predicted dehydrogenase
MPEPIRIGIIGAGQNTRERHIPGFQALEDVEIVAVCNRSRESGEFAAREFGIPHVHTDWREVIARDDLDAVCIGTWPSLHCEATLAALEAGKHVLTEARMAMNAAEAHRMLDASRKSDRVAQIVVAPWGLGVHNVVLRLLREGFIGEPFEVSCRFLSGDLLDRSRPLHWRQKPEYSGLNTLLLAAISEIIQRWLGDTTRVLASTRVFVSPRRDPESGAERPVEIADTVSVIADLACGARMVCHRSGLAMAAPDWTIEIYGSEGAIVYVHGDPISDQKVLAARRGDGELVEVPPEPGEGMDWAVESDFIASIRDGAPVRFTNFEDGVKYMEFMEAVIRSAEAGRAVDLPLGHAGA